MAAQPLEEIQIQYLGEDGQWHTLEGSFEARMGRAVKLAERGQQIEIAVGALDEQGMVRIVHRILRLAFTRGYLRSLANAHFGRN